MPDFVHFFVRMERCLIIMLLKSLGSGDLPVLEEQESDSVQPPESGTTVYTGDIQNVLDDDDLQKFYKKLDRSHPRFSSKSRYVCLECNATFKSPSNVKIHVLSVHLGRKSFPCDKCRLKFASETILKSHVKMAHLEVRQIQCDLCGTSFSSNQSLKYHLLRAHDSQRKFGCNQGPIQ